MVKNLIFTFFVIILYNKLFENDKNIVNFVIHLNKINMKILIVIAL
jgi:hypothetical protein